MSDDSGDQPPISIEYLAGFLDGEGCFTKDGRIHVTSTDHVLLRALAACFGGKVYPKKGPAHCAEAYQWNVPRATCRQLLARVIPHLRTKREVAITVWALAMLPPRISRADRDRQERRDRLRAEVARLNRRGA